MNAYVKGQDTLHGIDRGELLIELRDDRSGSWKLLFRETPTGVFAWMKHLDADDHPDSLVLSPEQADAVEEFLARAREHRERIYGAVPRCPTCGLANPGPEHMAHQPLLCSDKHAGARRTA